jgi:hypothetical protein
MPQGSCLKEAKMSHTIRKDKTKGFLDKLAVQRRTRKLIRDIRNEDFWMDMDEYYIPSAQI